MTLSLILLLNASVAAQELEPRAYSASPIGMNFIVIGFGRSSGSVLTDPNVQINDVRATLSNTVVGIGRTFGLAGRQSLITAAVPYVWGDVSGNVAEQRQRVTRSGLADMLMKFSVNLRGNPARTAAEFAKARKRDLIIGTSLAVTAPIGQYDGAKRVNLGTNRWGFKPEVGISYPVNKFDFDAYFGAWFFTSNNDFFPGGHLRTQDPVTALQAHVSYTFRPRLWLAGDVTWYRGGATSIEGGSSTIDANNSRAGLTVSLPLAKSQSLKVAYSTGTTSRLGTDFNTLAVAWQLSWFGSLLPR